MNQTTDIQKKAHKEMNKTPLFTVFRRESFKKWYGYVIRISVVLFTFILSLVLASAIGKDNPIHAFKLLVDGAFVNPWILLYDAALLLGFGLAVVPAFKMRFWNMGANGQVLIGALAACLVMFYGKNMNNILLIVLMFVAALAASILWSVLPAIFKAFFNTNETLFTLMMNYIAMELVAYANFAMAQGKKETPGIINFFNGKKGWLIFNGPNADMNKYLLPIIVIAIFAVFIYIYISKTKHGYEVTVLGDSEKTAKYVGMKTKWITIRTLFISGIITGVIGFFFASLVHHSVTYNLCGSTGFTAVLVAWLSNFNPLIMAGVSFFLAFLTKGTANITSTYQLGTNDLSSVIIAIIFFSILISEYFIRYRVKLNNENPIYKGVKNFLLKVKEFFQKLINKIFKKKTGEEEVK